MLVPEERLLASIPGRLAAFRDCLENLKREVVGLHPFVGPDLAPMINGMSQTSGMAAPWLSSSVANRFGLHAAHTGGSLRGQVLWHGSDGLDGTVPARAPKRPRFGR